MIARGSFRAKAIASSACLKANSGLSTKRRHKVGLALTETTDQSTLRTGMPKFDRWAFVCLPWGYEWTNGKARASRKIV